MNTETSLSSSQAYRPGPHWIAMVAAGFTLPLLVTGAQVTTNRVGMAVPDWPTTFGVNMFVYNFFEAPLGVVIEHRHRLFGSSLGLAMIVLAIWFAIADRRVWMKWLGFAVGILVLTQGFLGGLRVLKNSTTFAAIHGCTGQLVFAAIVALCVLTSRDWMQPKAITDDPDHLRRRSFITLGMIYAQIILGATLRHFGANLLLHAVMAAAVFGHAAWLWWRVETHRAEAPWLVGPSRWMALSLLLQIGLGIGAWWLLRPFDGTARQVSRVQAIARSGHVVNGALLLGSCLVITLRSLRHLRSPIMSADLTTSPSAARQVEVMV